MIAAIKEYIKLLKSEFDIEISEEELLEVWTKVHPDKPPSTLTEEDLPTLNALKKPDLVKLCKDRNIPITGTKDMLISRLIGKDAVKKPVKKITKKSVSSAPVIEKYFQRDELTISRNDFGNYEDRTTTFVFDPSSEMVIGKQQGSNIVPLTIEDIEKCRELKYQYIIPTNLES